MSGVCQFLRGLTKSKTVPFALMKATHSYSKLITLTAALAGLTTIQTATAESWKDEAISPVANPLFFESPLISSEIRPLFVYHQIADNFIGGFARVYAVQARWAVNDRLAIIATKDGYIDLQAKGLHTEGWADLAAGVKYALIDDEERQFILTPGLKFELPTGETDAFQGNGNGEFDVFVSAMKGWNKVHATASVGARLPLDLDEETAALHYSLQLDYNVCQYFIPFVALNGFTILTEGNGGFDLLGHPLNLSGANAVEGYDIINFGASDSGGESQIAFGLGMRSKVHKNIDLGFAWEKGISSPRGLFDHRFTVDAVIHF